MAKKGNVVKIDGKKMLASGGGGSDRVPEGTYKAKIIKVVNKPSSNDDPMLTLTYQISEGKYKGKKIVDRIVLTEKVYWKLRQVLEAQGKTIPKKVFGVNTDKLMEEEVAIDVVDGEPYKNRIKSEIATVMSVDDMPDDDEDEDEDTDDEDDDDDDDDDDDMEDVDLDDEL